MRIVIGLVIVAVGGCEAGSERPSDRPGSTLGLFAEGIVSTAAPEFATAFSVSGDTVFFNRTPSDRSRLDLFFSVREQGVWTEAQLFEPTAGISAIDPFVDPSTGRVYFSSDLDGSSANEGSFGLWYVEPNSDGWSSPVPLPAPINSDSSEVFNSLTSSGEMIFSSRRDGVRRIYSTRALGAGWSEPELVRFGSVEAGSNAVISSRGDFVVFAQSSPRGDSDLYVTCREDSRWLEPIDLGPDVNSEFTDFAPGLTESDLYFTSERPGVVGPLPDSVRPPGDIYRVDIETVMQHCRSDG